MPRLIRTGTDNAHDNRAGGPTGTICEAPIIVAEAKRVQASRVGVNRLVMPGSFRLHDEVHPQQVREETPQVCCQYLSSIASQRARTNESAVALRRQRSSSFRKHKNIRCCSYRCPTCAKYYGSRRKAIGRQVHRSARVTKRCRDFC